MSNNSILNFPTIDNLILQYQNTVAAQNPNANPYLQGTDWYVKGAALAGIISGGYADLAIQAQSIYPQYATGTTVDLWLASLGLSSRGAQTYATGNVYYNDDTANNFPVTINAGSTLTNSATGVIFTITQTTTLISANTTVPFVCTTIGIGYQQQVGQLLTLSPTVLDNSGNTVSSLTVFNSVDGSNIESDGQCVARILSARQNPPAGARTTDYLNFALEANNLLSSPQITGAIIIPAFISISNQRTILGIFGLAGTTPNDYLLNQSLINNDPQMFYSRLLSSDGITAIQTSIYNQKLVAANLAVASCDTYILPVPIDPLIQVNVQLLPNIQLSTVLSIDSTDEFNNPIIINITVENLILRECRRGIVNTQQLGVQNNIGQAFISLSDIQAIIGYGLGTGTINGIYATILASLQVLSYNGTSYIYQDIPVPTSLNGDGNIFGVYDIDYSNIEVAT